MSQWDNWRASPIAIADRSASPLVMHQKRVGSPQERVDPQLQIVSVVGS